jgi:hypothetical protein
MKHVKRYKNVIQAHHLEKIFSTVLPGTGIDFSKVPGYNPDFKESFEIAKNNLTKISKIP